MTQILELNMHTLYGLLIVVNQLNALENARTPEDMKFPGWDLHPLKGDLDGHWSVNVNGNWRITFTFNGSDAILVNYQDYH